MKREEALFILNELCPGQSEEKNIPDLQGFYIADPTKGTDPEGLELHLILSTESSKVETVKSLAATHGLALRAEEHSLVVYSPKKMGHV